MKKITFQDIFNAAWQAFIVERKPPSMKPYTMTPDEVECSYDDGKGGRCAVGLVLPEEVLAKDLGSFDNVVARHRGLFADDVVQTKPWSLNQFQYHLHDMHCQKATTNNIKWDIDHDELKKRFIRVANRFNCKVPV